MNILHENKVTGKEKGRKYLVYIIRLEYNLFYLRDLQVSLRGKEEEKKIMCKIVYRKPQLLIRVTNSCSGEVGTIGKTTKNNTVEHGYGLKNVEKVTDQYLGTMKVERKDNKFDVKIGLNL